MKTLLNILSFHFCLFLLAQGPNNNSFIEASSLDTFKNITAEELGPNGFNFNTFDTGINTKYSEYASGFFRDKFIMVSSKKIGGLGRIDKQTNEGYKNLFCLDINDNGTLELPLLFSRIINTRDNEDQITFSPDEKTIYFTRSTKENSGIYNLYKAELEEDSHGNWINQSHLDVNVSGYSIENPFVSPDGDKLYFSSNMPGSIGGYDLYVSNINPDGSLDTPKNLGSIVNTPYDDKYPSLSTDGKFLYFSSKGHKNIGGFDVFKSKINTSSFGSPRNLGNTVNSVYDEVAFILASNTEGYLSTNKINGYGKYDILKFDMTEVTQSLEGEIADLDTKILLPNALVILLDDNGNEISRQLSTTKARYAFNVTPLESYSIVVSKEGFNTTTFNFTANSTNSTTYTKNLELDATKAEIIEVEEKLMISVENIYFDYAKWSIKQESLIALNKIVTVLNENPEMKIEINAHTDIRGNDNYNLKLSNKRAKSALTYIVSKGIDDSRLISKGYGESMPVIDCSKTTKACNEKEHESNRRIEFVIIDK